jgi:alpha-L-rhamnosidase
MRLPCSSLSDASVRQTQTASAQSSVMTTARRVTPSDTLFAYLDKFWHERGRWPAKWVVHPDARTDQPVAVVFCNHFSLDTAVTLTLHVSADERYQLYLDGQRIGKGPQRGDRLNWSFETYELSLQPGSHTLVARVTRFYQNANQTAESPMAQISCRPGFICCADDRSFDQMFSTGIAPWKVRLDQSIEHLPKHMLVYAGSRFRLLGKHLPPDWPLGTGDGFVTPLDLGHGYNAFQQTDQPVDWILTPADLPAMREESLHLGTVRHAQLINAFPSLQSGIVDPASHDAGIAESFQALLSGAKPLLIQPHQRVRLIVDLENYYCAYPQLSTRGGSGSRVRLSWAESLYENNPDGSPPSLQNINHGIKNDRNQIHHKHFVGNGDEFLPDQHGAAALESSPVLRFVPPWWSAGRYVEIVVQTQDSPLEIIDLSFLQTHYPYRWQGNFTCDDARLAKIIPMGKRVMEMCSHETFMDCPYYEQLMYVGDTRLEALVAHTWTGDARLPRRAIDLFDKSRKSPGFTQSRYPARLQQVIPPFSAWWVAMVHDYMMWADDLKFVKAMLPGVRSVLDAFFLTQHDDGLIHGPNGWNFIDWSVGWNAGMPKDADTGASAPLNFKLAWVLKQAAEIEDVAGHSELALLHRRRARELASAAQAFWCPHRKLYADDLQHTQFSEHTNTLALLGDSVPESNWADTIDGLLNRDDLTRATIYFVHYLFELFGKLELPDRLIDRMGLWFKLHDLGFKTTIEAPEPSRSDCHAWGAHPLFHYVATLAGIRPTAAGFSKVRVKPLLGKLQRVNANMTTPRGLIRVDLHRSDHHLRGSIVLPPTLTGELVLPDRSIRTLHAGENAVE